MTEAQLTARRNNAQLSTGPRTAAGKKRSSLNAYRHGLTGQIIVQTPEDQKAFKKHCEGIREDLDPEGALETNLAQAIAEDHWRLSRVRALENGIFALGQIEQPPQDSDNPELDAALAPARTWMAHAHELHLLALYESRISRSVEKNMAQFRTLQRERKYAPIEAQLQNFLTARFKGEVDDPAGDLPPENPDSSVRSFERTANALCALTDEGGDPASNQPEPERFLEKSAAPLPEPAAQPSRPSPFQQAPPQRVSPRSNAKQLAATPFELRPGEWVRNPIGQPVARR